MPNALEDREVCKLGLAAETLRDCGKVRLELRGTSMLPSLWPGDLLTIQSVAHDEIVAGDIVLVLRDNRFFVHRVIESQQVQDCISWITRGDAVLHNDPPVAGSELLGRVVGIHRRNRVFVPSRRVSMFHSSLAWMLCRSDQFRNLILRIHAAYWQAGRTRPGRFFRGVVGAAQGVAGISPSHTSHP
jgi:signal peptidase I